KGCSPMVDRNPGRFEPPFSAFKGHPMTEHLPNVPPPTLAKLHVLGIRDAEQLLALAASPATRSELAQYLELPAGDLNAIVDQARQAIPQRLVAVLGEPAEPTRGLGVLPPTPAMLAAARRAPMLAPETQPAELPPSVTMVAQMPAVRNQSVRGTCVAFALT